MRAPNFERLHKVLMLEGEPDFIPFFELYVDNEVVEVLTKEPVTKLDTSKLKGFDRYSQCIVKFYRLFGYDYIPLRISPDFPRENILLTQDTAELSRKKRQWLNENNGTIKIWEDIGRYPWPNKEQLAESHLLRLRSLIKHLPSGMKVIPYTSGVFENVTRLLGTSPFLRMIFDRPKMIQEVFKRVGTTISYYLHVIAEVKKVGAILYNDDMGYTNGPFMSPNMFRQYVFPWQKRCADNVHHCDKPFILHACGNIGVIMQDLIKYVGIDAKHSYQDSNYPITEYKRIYSNQIALLGGVDVDKLTRLEKTSFKQYVRNLILQCAPGGGYALGSGNTVANYVSLKNYLTMLEIGKKYGKYPVQ
jgi:uroporphyrinogen decarboxylase